MIRPKWRFPGTTLVRGLGGLCVLAMSSVGVTLAQPASTLADLAKDPAVKAALDAVKANEPQTIEDQIRFCQIPAPSFKEEMRGKELERVFQQIGLQNVRVDKVGNVLGELTGRGVAPAPGPRRASRHRLPGRDRCPREARGEHPARTGHRRRLPRPRRARLGRP